MLGLTVSFLVLDAGGGMFCDGCVIRMPRLFAESVVRLSWLSVWGLCVCVCVCVCVRARARVCVCVFVRVFLQVKVIDVCVPAAAAAAAVFISPLYARLWDAHNPDGGGQGVCVSSWGDDNPNPAHGAWREVALTVLLVVAVSVGVTEGLPLPLVFCCCWIFRPE